MPDLPLPKPQPPTSANPAPATIPSSPVPPGGSVVSPQTAVPNKPPAVVTALSSVSSNHLPTIAPVVEEKPDSQPHVTNTSVTPTSVSTVAPPPTLASAQKTSSIGTTPSRGTPSNFGVDQPQTSASSVVSNPTASVPLTPTSIPTSQPDQAPSSSQPNSTPSITPPPPVGVKATVTPAPAVPTVLPPAPTTLPSASVQPNSAPQTSKANQPPVSPTVAKPKKSPLKLIIGIFVALIGLAVIAAIVLAVLNRPSRSSVDSETNQPDQPSGQAGSVGQTSPSGEQTTIEYWGLWETSDTLNSVFQDFQTQNPGITVRYVQQSHRDFRERLQNAIVSGSGPDVFRFHASWVPMLANELEPMPSSVMSTSEFSQTFYPVASRQLQLNGQLVGIPLMYEGLVLYYNQDVLETAGVQPPQTWSALRDAARTLTIKQENGQIQRGGVAIGTAENVDHFADILAVLMLQNGANLEQPNSPEGRDALLFYTNFVKQDQVWSADLPSSTLAFARGDVAMMFAPSWRAFEITQINPNLRFAAVSLPQLPNNKISWASYWAEGVSKQSQNKEAAWKLLQYLSQKEIQQKLFSAQSQTRAFGEPFSRVDLADQAATQPILGPLLQDAPTAQGWYMSTFTHDNGINDQIIQYYKDAINSLLGSGSIDQVLVTLQQGVNQVLSTYGVVAPLEPTPAVAQY